MMHNQSHFSQSVAQNVWELLLIQCDPLITWYSNSSPPGRIYASVNHLSIGSDDGLSPFWPMLTYCHLDSWEQTSVKFEFELYNFHSRRCAWKRCVPKWWPFCLGLNVLMLFDFRLMFDDIVCWGYVLIAGDWWIIWHKCFLACGANLSTYWGLKKNSWKYFQTLFSSFKILIKNFIEMCSQFSDW